MNEISTGLALLPGMDLPALFTAVSPLATSLPLTQPAIISIPSVDPGLVKFIVDLLISIGILLIGWIVATIVAGTIASLLKRTTIDNRIATAIFGSANSSHTIQIEKLLSGVVFWLIFLFALVIFLDRLQVPNASKLFGDFLAQIINYLPKVIGAGLLGAIAWVIATLVRVVTIQGLQTFRLDDRLKQQVGGEPEDHQFLLSETLANALYWFIFLLFLPSILEKLGLQGTLKPIQSLLDQVLSSLPNILLAVVIGGAGWLVAQVVRRIVTNLLAATGTDQLGAKFGLGRTGRQSLSTLLGTIVYVVILIPTAIASLTALKIEAISGPAIAMLDQVFKAIPQILTAGVILFVAYALGQIAANLVTDILTSVGFNNIFYWLGIQSKPAEHKAPVEPPAPIAPPPTAPGADPDATIPIFSPPTILQEDAAPPTRTPSELAGIVVLVGILLFATITATEVLNIPALSKIVSNISILLGNVLLGVVVFGIGLYLANLVFSLISSSGNRQARILAQTARISIIALVSAMALQQMGIASNIVNLAFGILFGAIAVAVAIAFGWGGRDIAAEQLREWLASFKDDKPSA